MGRKVHPIGMRLGINQGWQGRWFAEGAEYRQHLHQDFAIRNLLLGIPSKGGAAKSAEVRKLRKDLPDTVKNRKAGISRGRSRTLPRQDQGFDSHRQAWHFDWTQGRRREKDPRGAGSAGW